MLKFNSHPAGNLNIRRVTVVDPSPLRKKLVENLKNKIAQKLKPIENRYIIIEENEIETELGYGEGWYRGIVYDFEEGKIYKKYISHTFEDCGGYDDFEFNKNKIEYDFEKYDYLLMITDEIIWIYNNNANNSNDWVGLAYSPQQFIDNKNGIILDEKYYNYEEKINRIYTGRYPSL